MPREAIPTSEHPHHSESEYHLRIYQDADKEQLYQLYGNAMFWHSHSPLRPLLKISAKSPFMQALYLTFAFGAVIWCRYPTFGVAICVATAGVILFQVGFVSFLLLKFTRDTLQSDLRDIPKYYKLASLDGSDKTGGDFMPLGPRAFWVVEAKHRVTGETELAGCVGLDIMDEGRGVGELQRMVVSGRHLRRGVAVRLIKALVAHAKSHGLSSIFVATTNGQEAAVHLYQRFGWVEENRQNLATHLVLKGVQMISMRLALSGKNLDVNSS